MPSTQILHGGSNNQKMNKNAWSYLFEDSKCRLPSKKSKILFCAILFVHVLLYSLTTSANPVNPRTPYSKIPMHACYS